MWKLIVVALVVLVSCSDDGGDSDVALCREVFEVTPGSGATDEPCTDDEGELWWPSFGFMECDDGSTLKWNDRGWGFEGDEWTWVSGDNPPAEVSQDC